MRCLAAAAALITAAGCAHRPASSAPWGTPIVVMTIKTGYGAPSLGFTLYSTGRLLRADQSDPRAAELLTLSSRELRTLLRQMPLNRVGTAPPPVVAGLDGGTFCIVTWRGGQQQKDCVWGSPVSDEGHRVPEHVNAISQALFAAHGSAHERFVTHEALVELSAVDSIEGCPMTGAPWPAEWPAIESAPRTSRGDYVVFLSPAAAGELNRLGKHASACDYLVESKGRVYMFRSQPAWPHEALWYP